MKNQDEITRINRKHWNRMVDSGCDFTQPWLDLNRKKIIRFLEGDTKNSPDYLRQIYPLELLADVENKKVLCLAAGGGQQSVVFALLGAYVTVVDLSERQLGMDKKAAEHYGYQIELIHSDMQDLSDL
jgi:2-polyprenyl-3-methyl-5-hydroxy-6-metoxy-1,4-benzoquinol methylase